MSGGSSKSKRKRGDLTDDYSGGIQDEMNKFMSGSKKRHTIDSDSEEDNDDEYNRKKYSVLKDEDIEGQEEQEEEVDFDGETKITPFNMKDEMEEGYFDGQGTYIWNKKDASEVKDNWLDSVDWMKLKKVTSTEKEDKLQSEADSDSSLDSFQLADKSYTVPYYKQCLILMKPGETILKAIKRHGGTSKNLSASERLKQKKLAERKGNSSTSTTTESENSSDNSNTEAVTRLTEIASKFIALGDMDVYQETFESLTHKINSYQASPNPTSKLEMAPPDGLDMFSN